MKTIIITIAGGSASGKTTVVNDIMNEFDSDVICIKHDDYYSDQSHLTMEERLKTNYDHPLSIDNDLFVQHIRMLLKGNSIEKPIYDFNNHTRSDKVEKVDPHKIIILEGILVLDNEQLRDLSDIKIFVDADDDLRLIRRMQRDVKERGRDFDSVISQYLNTVKPMFHQFVRPTKRYADIIVPNDINHDVAVDLIITKIKSIIS